MKKDKKKVNKISKILEMPREVAGVEPKITIVGFEEMVIENYKGIMEYEDIFVKINTYVGFINISGFNLNLEQLTDEALCVRGAIEDISLESKKDLEEIE